MADIKSYRSPKVEVNGSKVEGKGVFEKEYIKKGETVFIKSGHIVSATEAKDLDEELGEYCLQINDDFFLCPKNKEEIEDLSIYVNHSCNPNVGPDGQISFVALRDIKSGEELCYDYAMTTSYDYQLECKCGSENCRKIITGDDWELKELQKEYGNHFTFHILKKIGS